MQSSSPTTASQPQFPPPLAQPAQQSQLVQQQGNLPQQQQADVRKFRIRRQPQFEVYGFVGWFTTLICYIVFLLWSFIPERVLHSAGIYYYPNQYWAIALPAYAVMTQTFLMFAYIMFFHYRTEPLHSMYTYTDEFARGEPKVVGDLTGRKPIPPISDISIIEVNKVLFGTVTRRKRRWNSTAL